MNQIIVPIPMRSERSWCETHDCECPCHDETEPWYTHALAIGGGLIAALIGAWAFITLLEWAVPGFGYKPTLVQVIREQWQWLRELSHRVF